MSSSSSSSSIPPLPAELILHILHLAYPPHAEDDYTGRSRDVLQCCLVSKQWKHLAEPVLWRCITLRPTMETVGRLEQQSTLCHLARSLTFLMASRGVPVEAFKAILNLFPETEHVRIAGNPGLESRFALAGLQCLPNLRSLSLDTASDFQTTLPTLAFLHILSPDFPFDVINPLTSAAFPLLRHLTLTAQGLLYPEEVLTDISLGNLAGQLETLELDADFLLQSTEVLRCPFRHVLLNLPTKQLPSRLSGPDNTPLVTVYRPYFDPSLPHPARYLRFSLDSMGSAWPELLRVFDLAYRPTAVFLPDTLLAPPEQDVDSGEHAKAPFLAQCRDEGIDVRYYRETKRPYRGLGCTEFRQYVEERKKKEEEAKSL
ncbi:hypothetical protein JCM8097_005695 [Rhodosporidiobolus ruineniae]